MHGQWTANHGQTANGVATLDLDDCNEYAEGFIQVFSDDYKFPGIIGFVKLEKKKAVHRFIMQLEAIDPRTLDIISIGDANRAFPDANLPAEVEVSLSFSKATASLDWSEKDGRSGKLLFTLSSANEKSDYLADRKVTTWAKFRDFSLSVEPNKFIFRGQSGPWRLRSAFHRTQRKNLIKFKNNDIQILHRTLSARTKHQFELNHLQQNAAFWNLIQHHGYPTPLLDWTYSPFVAAYFAFRASMERTPRKTKVRIFMFDRAQWHNDFRQMQFVSPCRPHFSMLQALAIENDRAIPQQALSSLTNIDDIESYIKDCESLKNKKYLRVFDISSTDRHRALRELGMMGITAGSMFPGLDGACEELRYRLFGPAS